MNQSILPTSSSKSALILFFFAILKCKSNSRYSLVHILPASSFKSALRSHQFFVKCKLSSCYSLVHILPTSFSKSAPQLSVFSILKCKSSSRRSPAHFLSTTFARTRGSRDPTSATRGATLPEQNQRVSPPRAFSTVNSHASELFHAATT